MPDVVHDGVMFGLDEFGAGPPLVLLHGFTGSRRSWAGIAEQLAEKLHVVAIDSIGHGASDAPAVASRYGFARALDDLAGIAKARGIGKAAWLGYSMGGRLALGLAIRHPELVSMLILESASPGIADPADRAARRIADEELAHRIEARGVNAFVDEWERLPMWSSQARLAPELLREQRQIRQRNSAAGLAGSLRGMGTGAQNPLWDRLAGIAAPTLIVAGELDSKFAAIAREMHAAIPDSELELVANAGHAVHLEQPGRFVERVTRFLIERGQPAIGSSQEVKAWA
jgi:2-succinyl-6-hydroxy-2,4-cyclohexadiene-1-carboxylate synthase